MRTLLAMFVLIPALANARVSDRDLIRNNDTTPLKVLCKVVGGTGGVMVQFVKDKDGNRGVYSVQRGMYYPANKIVRVTYELYGEYWSKVGHLDNGGKVRLYFDLQMNTVGVLNKSAALFGEDGQLADCVDLKIKK